MYQISNMRRNHGVLALTLGTVLVLGAAATLKSHLQMAEQMSPGVKTTSLRPKMEPRLARENLIFHYYRDRKFTLLTNLECLYGRLRQCERRRSA